MAEQQVSTGAVAATGTAEPGIGYLQWSAIFGGTAVATAISIVLMQFGSGAGLAAGDPVLADGTVSWAVLVAGLWTVLVAITSASAGAYLCGRMRARFGDATEDEVEVRDGVHGLVVWAAATLIVAAITGLSAALGATAAAAGAAQQGVEVSDDVLRLMANNSVILAFATAAGAALAAAAAWFAAVAGGYQRDEGLSIHTVVPKRFRKAA